jgi:hypothetical protein
MTIDQGEEHNWTMLALKRVDSELYEALRELETRILALEIRAARSDPEEERDD